MDINRIRILSDQFVNIYKDRLDTIIHENRIAGGFSQIYGQRRWWCRGITLLYRYTHTSASLLIVFLHPGDNDVGSSRRDWFFEDFSSDFRKEPNTDNILSHGEWAFPNRGENIVDFFSFWMFSTLIQLFSHSYMIGAKY